MRSSKWPATARNDLMADRTAVPRVKAAWTEVVRAIATLVCLMSASFPADAGDRAPFSSTIVNEVVRIRRTVFRNLGPEFLSSSLVGVDTVVAA